MVNCPKKCGYRVYLSELCRGAPCSENEGGKHYNHCTECPGFGRCIGELRDVHCPACGEHYCAAITAARGRPGWRGSCRMRKMMTRRAGTEEGVGEGLGWLNEKGGLSWGVGFVCG